MEVTAHFLHYTFQNDLVIYMHAKNLGIKYFRNLAND